VALADPLKRIARDVYAFTDTQLWGPSAERNKPDERYPREHTFPYNDMSLKLPADDREARGRAMVCSCCGWNGGSLRRDGSEPPPCYLTPRYALQLLGTEWGRQCYPDTWAALCVRTAKRLLESTFEDCKTPGFHPLYYTPAQGLYQGNNPRQVEVVTVSDVRFLNEMRVIREAGGKIVRVRRPGAGLGGSAGLHPSEAEQAGIPDEDFDFVVENTGSLADLKEEVRKLAQRLAK
jgi:hypothetical protein